MADPAPIPLTTLRIVPADPLFQDLLTWPFPTEPFFQAQVRDVLRNDIPTRFRLGFARAWIYRDPEGSTVGFGTLDLCREYEQFAEGGEHLYLPVLGVHPHFQGKGHGPRIVEHLVEQAEFVAADLEVASKLLFLDVYAANKKAIALYCKYGFEALNPDDPLLDPNQNNEPFIVMARRLG